MRDGAVAVAGVAVVCPPGPRWTATGARIPPPAGWFDHRTELGARGYKYLPPAQQYLLAAGRRAMADRKPDQDDFATQSWGVVVGTNSAVSSLHAAMDRTVVASGSNELSPMVTPYFSVNLAGGRLAAEHRLNGYHLTVTSPRTAGLEAIQVAGRALALGRARWLLIGSTEEVLAAGEPGAADSESGAVALVVHRPQSATEDGVGVCRVRTSFLPPASVASAEGMRDAAVVVDRMLAGLGLSRGAGAAFVAVLDSSPVGSAVAAAIERWRAPVLPAATGCLEPLIQVATALSTPSETTVVLSAAAEGNLALALVNPPGRR